MSITQIQVIADDAFIPKRKSNGAAGYDVFACFVVKKEDGSFLQDLPFELSPGESVLIDIGIKLAISFPWQCEIKSRSGLAVKCDIEAFNGVVDSDYRGPVLVLLRNKGKKSFIIKKFDRIAQMVFSRFEIPGFEIVKKLPETERGECGFGSTGKT